MRIALALASLLAAALPLTMPSAAGATVNVISLAGSGAGGFADGLGTQAKFNGPAGLGLDGGGNIYVADQYNKRIRKVTPGGYVSTVAGSSVGAAGDGQGPQASFNNPSGVKVGDDHNLYVADYQNGLVRRISPGSYVSTVPGGYYNQPRDVAIGHDGTIYVAEGASGWVEKIPPGGGRQQVAAGLREPTGIAVDPRGNLYVSDFGRQQVVKILPSGQRYVLAGQGNYGVQDGGPGVGTLGRPAGVALDPAGCVYVADVGTRRIRRITPYGQVTTLAGSTLGFADGPGPWARFDKPIGIASPGGGIVYVGDSGNYRIRKLSGVPACPRSVPTRRLTLNRASALRNGVPVTCGTNEPATCTIRAAVGRRPAGLGSLFVSYAGTRSTHVRLGAAARSAGVVVLRATLSDRAGTRPAFTLVVSLRG